MPVRWIVLGALMAIVCSPMPAKPSGQTSSSSAKFSAMCEQFINETLAASPSAASQAGYHFHVDPESRKKIALDALLDDVSDAGWAERRRIYVHWRERFHREAAVASLGAEDAADWRLIDDQIALSLLELNRIQNYKHNPTVYVELVGTALFQPMMDDYASEDVRLGDVVSRVGAIPKFLDQARGQLMDADPIFIKVAVEENEGNIELIQNTISGSHPSRHAF